jgi:hypothetical protein
MASAAVLSGTGKPLGSSTNNTSDVPLLSDGKNPHYSINLPSMLRLCSADQHQPQHSAPIARACRIDYVPVMSDTNMIARDGRFVNGGNPGPGRPLGQRNKLGEQFLIDLRESWNRDGAVALARCAQEDPVGYCRIVAGLMPKDFNISMSLDVADFANKFRTACELLGNEEPIKPRRSLRVINHVR